MPGISRDFEGCTGRCGHNCQAYLPIDVFSVFEGEHVQPLGTDSTVENAIGPDPVGADLLFLNVTFQRLAVEGVFGEVTKGFFDTFSRGKKKGREYFLGQAH